MVQTHRPHRPVMTHRRLLLFKWLMVFVPPVTVAVGHVTVTVGHNPQPNTMGGVAETLLVILLVTFLALVLAYIFVETLFRVLRRLQAEALAQEQDILTMSAVMQERERLSRELHDGVAQLVADLLLRLDTIKELVEADRSREAEAELERLHGVADEIYEDIGESITGLRTNMTERGLVRALQDYLDRFEERYRIPTSLRTDDAADQLSHLSPLAALQLFRLVQEALTNVRKHAAAREATVTLVTIMSDGSGQSGQLKVVIADDGQGFAPGGGGDGLNWASPKNHAKQRDDPSLASSEPALSEAKGPSSGQALAVGGTWRPLGLTSMRERVEALGGRFQVTGQPGSGTQVTATIPITTITTIPRTRRENGHAALATPAG